MAGIFPCIYPLYTRRNSSFSEAPGQFHLLVKCLVLADHGTCRHRGCPWGDRMLTIKIDHRHTHIYVIIIYVYAYIYI